MLVRELVGGEVLAVSPDVPIAETARIMKANDIGSLAVTGRDGDLEGIITERDLVAVLAAGVDASRAQTSQWMTEYPDTFGPEMDVIEASEWMLASGYRHIPVVENGLPVGMISIKDVLWAVTGPGG